VFHDFFDYLTTPKCNRKWNTEITVYQVAYFLKRTLYRDIAIRRGLEEAYFTGLEQIYPVD
jgi:hypothetical protein